MLDLCGILGISVNELLSGEKIEGEHYEEKTERLLLEMARKEEAKNRRLLLDMWGLTGTALVFFCRAVSCCTLYDFWRAGTGNQFPERRGRRVFLTGSTTEFCKN